jgi:hypothetical protein
VHFKDPAKAAHFAREVFAVLLTAEMKVGCLLAK